MKTEKEKMLSGELYIASDEVLVSERLKAKRLLHQLNVTGFVIYGKCPVSYCGVSS